jgi:hypothetical protein
MEYHTTALARQPGCVAFMGADGSIVQTYRSGDLIDVVRSLGAWCFDVDIDTDIVRVQINHARGQIRAHAALANAFGLIRVNLDDSAGRHVSGVDVLSLVDTVSLEIEERRASRRLFGGTLPREEFRRGPVPGVHKRGRYGWFRGMDTYAARRAAAGFATDDEAGEAGVRHRAKRNLANLPTAWNDIGRCVDRSWKRHRLNQWKEVQA